VFSWLNALRSLKTKLMHAITCYVKLIYGNYFRHSYLDLGIFVLCVYLSFMYPLLSCYMLNNDA